MALSVSATGTAAAAVAARRRGDGGGYGSVQPSAAHTEQVQQLGQDKTDARDVEKQKN